MNLTDNEKLLLIASRNNNFCDAVEGDTPWVFAVIDESHLDAKVARGAIASLVKKGLVEICDYEGKGRASDMGFVLTEEGTQATIELTENTPEQKQQLTDLCGSMRTYWDKAENRMSLYSELCENKEYYPTGILVFDMDSLTIWSFRSVAAAIEGMKEVKLNRNIQAFVEKLPENIAQEAFLLTIGTEDEEDIDNKYWQRFFIILTANLSTELGEQLWIEANDILGQLMSV